jgi:nickel-dependent lactate racemase
MALFLSRGRNETVPDQWQTQIFLRVLSRATVLYLSEAPDEVVEALHMIPVHSIEEGLQKAKAILNKDNITVTAIPDGVSVMVLKEESV